jgi:hypothetical protein
MRRDRGEILLAILPLLAGIAALSAAMLFYAGAAKAASAENGRIREKTAALSKIRAIAERLLDGATPEADSPFDLFALEGASVVIEDLSASCLLRQAGSGSADGAPGGPGYLDPFLASDASILAAAKKRMPRGESFENLLARLRACPVDEAGKASISAALRAFSPMLFPALSAASPVNVNFASMDILQRALTSYGTDPAVARNFAERIAEERQGREILPLWLAESEAALGIPERARMAIGTKTWFWRISVRVKDREYESLVSALPNEACTETESMTLLSFGRRE